MTVAWQLGAVLALILGLLVAMALLARVARQRNWHPEVARKIVHVAASTLVIPLPWLFPEIWPVWLLLGLALSAMLAMRTSLLAGPGRALHSVDRQSWGDVLLVVSVGLLLLLYGGEPVLYVLPLLVVALGDAAAALTGSAYGRNFYQTEDGRKTIEGSAMFFLVTLILAMICLLLLTGTGRGALIIVALAIAAFATLIEADSWRGFDNLFLPMGVFLFLFNIVGPEEETTLPGMTLPLLGMLLAFGLTRAAGMGLQVSRVYAVAIFMMLSATNFWNAILPALALAAHAFVARRKPDANAADTLNVVSGLALVSFGFLALGAVGGVSLINFYGLFCGALAAAHLMRGLPGLGPQVAVPLALVVAAVIWAFWHLLTGFNNVFAHWHPPLNIPAAGVFALAALVPVLQPAPFAGAAANRITLLAALPTLALYGAYYLLFRTTV